MTRRWAPLLLLAALVWFGTLGIRPLYKRPIFQVLLTLGLVFVINETVKLIWTAEIHSMPRPASLNGVFVLTRDGMLHRSGAVELAVKMPQAGSNSIRRFHAQVVHASAEGVGLLFDHVNSKDYIPLLRLVFAKRKLPETP